MATFTITTSQNIDELTSKAGGDIYNVNGGTLVIDQDSRYGANQTTSTSLGNITISATLGGTVTIDARYVRLIPYSGGSGTVPASNTVITRGSSSGKLIGVWSALNAAPAASGAAMPASGFIKIKQWNSVEYTAGALTGITATATGPSTVGWIELVGDEAATINTPRLGKFEMKGEWYSLGTTSGVNTTTYQVPTSGSITYSPGVWVETDVGSGVYEIYPCAGSVSALDTAMATDIRGKVCWVSTAGLLRFQNDGTNSTGGYLPPSGLKIRIPNIITENCTTAARTVNALPNATLATRYDFTTTGGAVIEIDKVVLNWYPSFSQPFSVSISNCIVAEQISISEVASTTTFSNICVGQNTANTQFGLSMNLCFAGGTISDCVFTRANLSTNGYYAVSITDISGFDFLRTKSCSLVGRTIAGIGCITATRMDDCDWTDCIVGGGEVLLTSCTDCSFVNTSYYDHPSLTTRTANSSYLFDLVSLCSYILIEGASILCPLCGPYAGVIMIGSAGCNNIKIRNIGSISNPVTLGGTNKLEATWTKSGSTVTVTTPSPHGFASGVGTGFYLLSMSDAAAGIPGAKTVTSTGSNTFTFVATAGGSASGTLIYCQVVPAYLVNILSGAAANNIKIQRCYVSGVRSRLFMLYNDSKNISIEDSYGTDSLSFSPNSLNVTARHLQVDPAFSSSSAIYGTHWLDVYNSSAPQNDVDSWTRSTTTATVTSNNHGLKSGTIIDVISSSAPGTIPLGQKTISVTSVNAFTFPCINTGATSGTFTYITANGRLGFFSNEPSLDTASQVTVSSGTPKFTSAGSLYMPNVGDEVVLEMPSYLIGYDGFSAVEPVMTGGTITNHNCMFAIDLNDGNGYGSWKNLLWSCSGGSGTNGQYTLTVTDSTGVSVNDYVYGTNIGYRAKVTQINGNTITVDSANIGTVSGIIRFSALPNFTVSPSNGFKMKWKITTIVSNTAAISTLYIFLYAGPTSMLYQYPLDAIQSSLTLTDLQAGSEVRLFRSDSGLELGGIESSGTTYTYNYVWSGDIDIDIVVLHMDYEYIRIPTYTLTSDPGSIPIQQRFDRNFSNP